MAEKKRQYRKGMTLIHAENREKIMFGAFDGKGNATCLNAKKMFVSIPKDVLDSDYVSEAELKKRAQEKRRGQCW